MTALKCCENYVYTESAPVYSFNGFDPTVPPVLAANQSFVNCCRALIDSYLPSGGPMQSYLAMNVYDECCFLEQYSLLAAKQRSFCVWR